MKTKTNPDAEELEGLGRMSEELLEWGHAGRDRLRMESPGKDGRPAVCEGPTCCTLQLLQPCLGGN